MQQKQLGINGIYWPLLTIHMNKFNNIGFI